MSNNTAKVLEDLDLKAAAIDATRKVYMLAQRDARARHLRQIDPAKINDLVDRFMVELARECAALLATDSKEGPRS